MENKYKIESTNSQIAIGSSITQTQEHNSNVFNNLRITVKENIKDENEKIIILEIIESLEKHKNDKKKFKKIYDNFILKLGTYINIFSPFLPLLVKYLPQSN